MGPEMTAGVNVVPVSATWIANRALYVPWYVMEPCTVSEVFWLNGATALGNVTVGVYGSTSDLTPGSKLCACAATAQSGTSAIQTAAVTDTAIPVGLNWIAIHGTSSTGTFFRQSYMTVAFARSLGLCSESVVTTLPTTATPVGTTTNEIPQFGVMILPRTLV